MEGATLKKQRIRAFWKQGPDQLWAVVTLRVSQLNHSLSFYHIPDSTTLRWLSLVGWGEGSVVPWLPNSQGYSEVVFFYLFYAGWRYIVALTNILISNTWGGLEQHLYSSYHPTYKKYRQRGPKRNYMTLATSLWTLHLRIQEEKSSRLHATQGYTQQRRPQESQAHPC
jgi:hypothetical protein